MITDQGFVILKVNLIRRSIVLWVNDSNINSSKFC